MGAVISYEPYKATKVENNTITGLFSGFASEKYRLGAEINYQKDSAKNDANYLTSVYGTFRLSEKFDFFGRVDNFQGDKSENYLITGFIYTPHKSLNIAPNIGLTWGNKRAQNYKINFQFKY